MAADRTEDAALETLFLPFVDGRLSWPEDEVLFLRARAGAPLQRSSAARLVCEQSFKPDADALLQAGLKVQDEAASTGRTYPLVLMLPPRQRDEARALMARALDIAGPAGRVVAAVSNNEGARSSEADLAQLAGSVVSMTKNKCRVFWSEPSQTTGDEPLRSPPQAGEEIGSHVIDVQLAAQWRTLDAVRPIEDGRFLSRPGVFAWDRIDVASALLAEHLPTDLAGRAADLGAGFGYLSVELLTRCPGITALDLYEAEARALDLARRNLAALEQRSSIAYHWHDVTAGLPRAYDVIVTNPPFHTQSRTDRPDIGRRFIATAAESLRPGGRLWLVANRHLPYEAVLADKFSGVRTVVQRHGFKIVEAIKSPASGRSKSKAVR